MTVNEAVAVLRWSYSKARRYFSQVEGICVSYQPKRYKRPYREPESTEIIHRRIALAGQK
jgi:hypothetical protein